MFWSFFFRGLWAVMVIILPFFFMPWYWVIVLWIYGSISPLLSMPIISIFRMRAAHPKIPLLLAYGALEYLIFLIIYKFVFLHFSAPHAFFSLVIVCYFLNQLARAYRNPLQTDEAEICEFYGYFIVWLISIFLFPI